MKLAEALILRADTQKRMRQVAERLYANLRVQELDELHKQLEQLVKAINPYDHMLNFSHCEGG